MNPLLRFWVHPVSACVCKTPQGKRSLRGHAEYRVKRIHIVIHGVKRSGLTVRQTYLLRRTYPRILSLIKTTHPSVGADIDSAVFVREDGAVIAI